MNYLDLFHGIGGFALGAYWAGMKFENHYCSDIEPYCQQLYKLRFPDSVQLGDITKIKTEDLPNGEWIISGGFPCQDISIAGKGAGLEGERSGLWFEYWRLIRDLRPRYAIMENVGALTFRGLDRVLGSLAEIGYNAEWQDIRASDVGAPHRRERIWIVAYPNTDFFRCGPGSNNERQHQNNIFEIRKAEKNKQSRSFGECGTCEILSNNAANPDCDALQEQYDESSTNQKEIKFDKRSEQKYAKNSRCKYGKKRPEELGRIQGLHGERNTCDQFERPDTARIWNETIESRIARMDDGVSRKLDADRLRGCGNAIVPQIAEIIFRSLTI